MAKRLTPNQRAWQKEIERIDRFIQKNTSKGFLFSTDIIPERPTRITQKSLRELRSLRGKKLYSYSTYTLPTGEQVSGDVGEQYIKDTKGLQRLEDIVLRNVEEIINTWQPLTNWSEGFTRLKEQDKNIAKNILNGAIQRDGRTVVAARLEANATEVIKTIETICYGQSGKEKDGGDYAQSQLQYFNYLCLGRSLTLEENAAVTDFTEYQTV